VHRVGRTGRAGRTGISITFVSPEQEGEVGRMAAKLSLAKEFADGNMTIPTGRPSGPARPVGGRGHRPTPAGARPRRRRTGNGGGASAASAGGTRRRGW
jgi:superfamily II DNA/RNA helicase